MGEQKVWSMKTAVQKRRDFPKRWPHLKDNQELA